MLPAVLAGLAAAVCNGLAGVLQHDAARRTTARRALQFRLLAELVRDRRWLAGTLVNLAGLGLQVAALASGPLLLVQPLLVLSLLVIVVARAVRERTRPRGRTVAGALLTCLGLVACLLAARPRPAAGEVGSDAKAITLGVVLVVLLAGCLALARWSDGNLRAVALAVGAGLSYGVAAGLVKVVAHELSHGLAVPFTRWPLYVVVVVLVLGVQLNQAAFQAGTLAAPAAVITVSDQVSSVAVGLALLGETVRTAHGPLELMVVGFLAMVLGIVALARESPGTGPRTGTAPGDGTGDGRAVSRDEPRRNA